MRVRKMVLLVGGGGLLFGALAAAVLVACRAPAATPTAAAGGPIAVVLVPRLDGSELVSVDVGTGRVAGRLRLRSLATDMDADTSAGVVVAAQTGGIAGSADDAISIIDPRSGSVRYLTLPRIDPSQLKVIGTRAIVLHAVVDRAGFLVSSVDLRSGAATTGHAPDGTGLWCLASGWLWTSVPTGGPVPFALVRVDPATLATRPGPDVGFNPAGVVTSGDDVLVMGAAPNGAMPARLALLGPDAATIETASAVSGLAHGAQIAATVGNTIVVGDWCGELPETSSLAVVDRSTLRRIGTLAIGGAPCAIAAWGRWLLVVDRLNGELVKIDPRDGVVSWKTKLGASDLVSSKIVVLP